MNILQKSLLRIAGLRSFENGFNLTSNSNCGNCGACSDCNGMDFDNSYSSNGANKPIFTKKDKEAYKFADHPIFAFNCQLITNKVANSQYYITSKNGNVKNEAFLRSRMEGLGIDVEFIEQVVKNLYSECGVSLITYNKENKLIIIPFLQEGQEIVKVNYIPNTNTIEDIEITVNTKFTREKIVIDPVLTPVHIIYNMKSGNSYSSNLTIASPYIALSNELLEKDIELARNNFTVDAFVSPNIEAMINKDNKVDFSIGGVKQDFTTFLSSGWITVKKQLIRILKEKGIKFIPYAVDVKNLTLSNSQNQTMELRKYLDEKITTACFTSGSISGRDNTANRSVSEQDRDNFEELTIKYYQNKVESLINDFVIKSILPSSYNDFYFSFTNPETDETLKLREQNTKVLELITQPNFQLLLEKNNLRVNKEDLSNIFVNLYGINLIDKQENDNDTSIQGNEVNIDSSQVIENSLRVAIDNPVDSVFKEFYQLTNMSYGQLLNWSKNPKSKLIGSDVSQINMTLDLLNTNKVNWNKKQLDNAKKVISSIKRILKAKNGNDIKVNKQSIGLSKKDIALKNYGYDNQKVIRHTNTSSIFLRAVQEDSLPIMDFTEFESSDNHNLIINQIRKALKAQYKDILTKNNTSSYSISKYLSKEQFKTQLKLFTNNVTRDYNNSYSSSISPNIRAIDRLIDDVITLIYEGGQIQNVDSDGKLVINNYDGYDSSNRKTLDSLRTLEAGQVDNLIESKLVSFNSNLFLPLYKNTLNALAIDDKLMYVGYIGVEDNKIRKHHKANSRYFFKQGSELRDNTNPYFFTEPNCRCRTVYGTKNQLLKAGLRFYE
jgi:hypothetical protein